MSDQSSDKPYRVGRSRTGLGLFATAPIAKGTEIIRYVGRMLDARNKDDDAVENKYLFQINGRWTIDGSVRSNTARYINHACRPNAESHVRQRERTVTIRAIKNIKPGEEINYDYGTEYFKMYLKPIGCKCTSCEKRRAKKLAAEAGNGKAKPEKAASKAKFLKQEPSKKEKRSKNAANGKSATAKPTPTKSSPKKPSPKKSSSKAAPPKKAAPKRAGRKAAAS
ncbi:MAG TPA: SET domain-containing protein [Xanthobacteraceae bacterium]|nr:SET domain-containing protein [Xanthobacteraceae bacterium]